MSTIVLSEFALMEVRHVIEEIFNQSINPLTNPLEVGFRHGPLTTPEKLKRYEDASASVAMSAQYLMKLIDSYTKSEQKI